MKGAAMVLEKSNWSGSTTQADRGLAHSMPELTLKMRGRSLDWACTPVFLPGESHGQRSLASYSP